MVKRSHMITRAYLEQWANDRGVVHVFDGENNVNHPSSVLNATVVSYGYRAEVVPFDLEAHYEKIESRAIPALRGLASGAFPNRDGRSAVVSFLDMHLERGRYADQAKVRMPAWLGDTSGPGRVAEMALGDRLTLARDVDTGAVRLEPARLETWDWRVLPISGGLVTGDGAVLLFQATESSGLSAVAFPVSPDKLLVIGDGLPGIPPYLNFIIMGRCRRWLVDRVDGQIARLARTR
jgi:hypothetical protein